MVIEFVKTWRAIPVGVVREWPDGAANVLIRRGFAVEQVKPKEADGKNKRNRK